MPAFNAEATIGAAARSVLDQTCDDLELVVVDDGSTDGTASALAALEGDERLQLLRQPNSGAAAARNTGLTAARGRLVSFIDSDDLWMPTYLAEMSDALDRSPGAGLAYTDAWTLDRQRGRIGAATAMHWQDPPLPPPAEPTAFLRELLRRNFVYTATMVPAAVFEHVGPFRATLPAAIDYEMWLRIVAHGYRAVRSPHLLAVYTRGRPGSISSNRTTVLSSLVEVFGLVAESYPVDDETRALARRRRQEMRAELVALQGGGGLDGLWRARLRPRVVRARNAVFRRDGWLAEPPAEVVAAFPEIGRDGPSVARHD